MDGNKACIRLMIADDHELIRQGLRHVLENHADLSIVAEAANGDELLIALKSNAVDILLLDVSMPGPGFISLMQQLQKKHPDIKILVLSVHPEDHYALRAVKAGARGYMEKNLTPDELYLAIRTISAGKQYISRSLHEQLIAGKQDRVESSLHARLSDRELQILLLMGSGKAVAEISTELFLSPKTVSTYRKRILDKLGYSNNSELIRYCLINELA